MSITKIQTLRASSAQLVGTETGTAIKLQEAFHQYTFVLDVTLLADDVDDTLDVYIDTSFDGGTTWINIGHFSQVLGNAAAQKHLINIHEAVNSELNVTDDVAVGSVRNMGMGDQLRYRATVVDPTGADASFTYSLTAQYRNGNH